MNEFEHIVLGILGVLCIPLSALILKVLYGRLFANRRWHRTGLWFFSLGYAVLAFGILCEFFGLENGLWIYLLADTALVIAPCIILLSYKLGRLTDKHTPFR